MKTEISNRNFLFFLLHVLIFAVFAVGIVVGTNYYVDGSHVITSRSQDEMASLVMEGKTVAVPENYNERIFQMAVLDRMTVIPDTVVIGSSRGMLLGTQITGFESLYNNCISGFCLEDCYAILGLYRQKFSAYPSRIIMEISPWIFYGDNPEFRWTELYKYRTAAEALYLRLNRKKPQIRISEQTPSGSGGRPFYTRENPYFSLAYFQYNIEILRRKGMDAFRGEPAHVSTDPDEAGEFPDGSMRYPAAMENANEERLEKVKTASGPVTYENVDRMTHIDSVKREAFESLIIDILNNDTEVIFFLQPFSLRQCWFSFDENQNPAFVLVESYLHEFAEENSISVVGSYDARKYPIDDEYFVDSIHPDRDGTRIVWSTDYPE